MRNVFVTPSGHQALMGVPGLNKAQLAGLTDAVASMKAYYGYVTGIDWNPFDIPGGIVACGPTTGRWMEANRLRWWGEVEVGGVWFTLAVHDA